MSAKIIAARTFAVQYYRAPDRVTREVLLADGTTRRLTPDDALPPSVPHTRGCREANGRCYGGGDWGNLIPGWRFDVAPEKVAAELLRRAGGQ